MAYKIVFFDMDGTLYQTENDIIQESSLQAIQALRGSGLYRVCRNRSTAESDESDSGACTV